MKFSNKLFLRRHRSNRSFELYPSDSEVTHGSVEVWTKLPDEIRLDPSLVQFQRHYQRINSLSETTDEPEDDQNMASDNVFITINLQNIHEEGNDQLQTDGEDGKTLSDHAIETANEPNVAKANMSHHVFNMIKIALLVGVWILFTGILMSKDEKVLKYHQISIPIGQNKSYIVDEVPVEPRFGVIVSGAFADENSNSTSFLYIRAQLMHEHLEDGSDHSNSSFVVFHDKTITIPIVENINDTDRATEVTKSHIFLLDSEMFEQIGWNDTVLSLEIATNLPNGFPINVAFDPTPMDKSMGIIYAAIILISLYVLIIWEIIDRTFAAMVASTMSIAILALMNERPTMPEILSWIDVETLLLLFGMMILVGILSETGLFDYLAVYAFKITKGEPWPLIYCLCLFTAFLSAILDNVTTLLLMAPVSIRLCEIMKLNPVPILMSMIIYSNIGGAVTPVGDPPNIIIASNSHVIRSGINFLNFTIHMLIGAVFVMIQTYFHLRFVYRTINDLRVSEPEDITELRNDIVLWERAAESLSSSSKDEDLVREILLRKINRLQLELKRKITCGSISTATYKRTLDDLQKKYPIRNRALLIKSSVALTFVLCCFFFHSLPYIERLSLGWTALLGAILLLILADRRDIESILERVEWSTLLFFAVLFILMECLAKLSLIEWIGAQTENVILMVSKEFRLAVAILIVLWVSAIASAFVDNIPLTTMMIRVTISLSEKAALNLPLQPLIWALSFGACLGGNGTLIGASANIICASVAEQHGYRFTFIQFFKLAFPAMIGSLVVASGYLLVCHVCFTWH